MPTAGSTSMNSSAYWPRSSNGIFPATSNSGEVADPDAGVDPAVAQPVDRGQLLGGDQRIQVPEHQDAGAQANGGRGHGRGGQRDQRIVVVARAEPLLDEVDVNDVMTDPQRPAPSVRRARPARRHRGDQPGPSCWAGRNRCALRSPPAEDAFGVLAGVGRRVRPGRRSPAAPTEALPGYPGPLGLLAGEELEGPVEPPGVQVRVRGDLVRGTHLGPGQLALLRLLEDELGRMLPQKASIRSTMSCITGWRCAAVA